MLSIIFFSLLTFSFLLSGIANDVRNITHISVMAAILVGFMTLVVSKKQIKIPPNFAPLLVFTAILQVYLLFVKVKLPPFYYALLFTEGLSLWFIVYNLETRFSKYLYLLFIIPG